MLPDGVNHFIGLTKGDGVAGGGTSTLGFRFRRRGNEFYAPEFKARCVCTGRKPMRTIAYALALALGVAFATSAFAADVTTAKTKADCEKAGGMWDAATNACKSKM
jgi:hypothetical protein